jgi:DNA-binding CsgD family transcriptional regulator
VLPPAPRTALLSRRDLHAALELVGNVADAIDDADGFARRSVEQLRWLATSELTTLSVCDLRSGHRHVIGMPPLSRQSRAALCASATCDAPIVRNTPLYDEYYRRISIDHTVAVPLHTDEGWLVSFVLNRSGRDFSDREVALLDQVRRVLSRLFDRSHLLERTRGACGAADLPPEPPSLSASLPLTWREREVLQWAAAGKTDRDIADILAISHRTVHKHLQRVYSKLGVETRTAAVMRAIARV